MMRKLLTVGLFVALCVAAGIMGITANVLAQKEYTPVSVRVHTGDTVWSIAGKYTSNKEDIREVMWRIKEANNLKNYNVQPGQELIVPVKK